jgi:hypothetical protein
MKKDKDCQCKLGEQARMASTRCILLLGLKHWLESESKLSDISASYRDSWLALDPTQSLDTALYLLAWWKSKGQKGEAKYFVPERLCASVQHFGLKK